MKNVAVLALLLVGCGRESVRAAERGDWAALHRAIDLRHREGHLSNGEAVAIAHSVAKREIVTTREPTAALSRISEAADCAHELDDALEERAQKLDPPGAAAALMRVESGGLSHRGARRFLENQDDRWKAVGVRALGRPGDRSARQAAMLDPSEIIRKSALRASRDARDPADIPILLETARLDPALILRSEAVRALGAVLGANVRDKDVTDAVWRLADLWASADPALREDVAVAWSVHPLWERGGHDALRDRIAIDGGVGALVAAVAVRRRAPGDQELTGAASALIVRAIADATSSERLLAIEEAEMRGLELDAVRKAARDADREVAVAALGRLLENPADETRAREALMTAARLETSSERLAIARRARWLLARAGDRRVQAWVEADAASSDPLARVEAARALVAMGRGSRVAPLLADPDPSVRMRVACLLVSR